jgi:hypothetical protein
MEHNAQNQNFKLPQIENIEINLFHMKHRNFVTLNLLFLNIHKQLNS